VRGRVADTWDCRPLLAELRDGNAMRSQSVVASAMSHSLALSCRTW
jgi:hypothetical protein